ncbi:MAG: hypothetical protein DRP91_00475 [Candidatus Neomarinimicrobiota bacterium]|nr:MAG: hypothetical protein DRP91_00475 [Candidatus Neomarinimicrobiota bacterium]
MRNSCVFLALFLVLFWIGSINSQTNRKLNAVGRELNDKYRMALYFERQGLYDKALEIYRYLFEQQPRNNQFYNRYVDILLEKGAYEEAEEAVNLKLQLEPSNVEARIDYAKLQIMKGDTAQGIACFSRLLASARYSEYMCSRIFNNLISMGIYDKAEEMIVDVRRRLNNDLYFALELGNFYQLRKDYKRALMEYMKLYAERPGYYNLIRRHISRIPVDKKNVFSLDSIIVNNRRLIDNPDVYKLRADLFYKSGFYDSSMSLVMTLEREKGYKGTDILELARKFFRDGKYKWSEKIYLSILERNLFKHVHLDALMGLANCYFEMVLSPGLYNPFVYFYPDNIYFRLDFAYGVSLKGQKIKRAYSIFDSLAFYVGVPDLSSDASYKVGVLEYRLKRDFDSAERFFKRAYNSCRGADKKGKIAINIIDTYIARGDLGGAKQKCLKYLEIFEGTPTEKLLKIKMSQVLFLENRIDSVLSMKNDLLGLISPNSEYANDVMEFFQFIDRFYTFSDRVGKEAFGMFVRAERLLHQDKLTEAFEIYRKIWEKIGEKDIAMASLFRVAQISLLFDRVDEAVGYVDPLLACRCDFSEFAVLMIGDYFVSKGKYKTALKWYEFFIESYPGSLLIEKVRRKYREIEKLTGVSS